MKYGEFKKMIEIVRNDVAGLVYRGEAIEEIIEDIRDMVIYTFFWDVKNDMPTCDFDQMEKAIQNTVRHLLRSK